MPFYDDNITIVPKATSPTITVVPKATSPTITVVPKATSPNITKVPKPYIDPLIILTESGEDIFIEEGSPMTVQGVI